RMVGPVSRAEGGHRPGDQEDGKQPDPDPGLSPVGGSAQWIAVQPERTSQPPEATRPARPGFHGLTVAQPLMYSAGDVEVVTDLHDAAGHPRGADHRVAFGPGADVPAQRYRVPAAVHRNV